MEDDIYGNKSKYEKIMASTEEYLKPTKFKKIGDRKYFIRNPANLYENFPKLRLYFTSQDLSYKRRLKLWEMFVTCSYFTEKNFKDCNQEDISHIVSCLHEVRLTITSKRDFIKDLNVMIKLGMFASDVKPLSGKINAAKQTIRDEKFGMEDFSRIMNYFDDSPCIQAYLSGIFESFGRPQELAYLKIKDFEFYDNYCKAHISSHGKTGTKVIYFMNLSFPYILRWFKSHPQKNNRDAYFFLMKYGNELRQVTPYSVNRRLKQACATLNLPRAISPYSFKRAGISQELLNGVSEKEIIIRAGWVDSKPLKHYDLTTTQEVYFRVLQRKGLVTEQKTMTPTTEPELKVCPFCKTPNSFTSVVCDTCLRPLNKQLFSEVNNPNDGILKSIQEKFFKMEQLVAELQRQNDVVRKT